MFSLHPEHVDPLEAVEHDEAEDGGPEGDGAKPDQVPRESLEGRLGPAHEDAIPLENVYGHSAPDTSDPVDGNGVQRVVDAHDHQQPVEEEEERAGQRPDHHGRPCRVYVAPGAQGHRPGQRAVHGDEEAVVVSGSGNEANLVEEKGADAGGGGAQGRVDDGRGDGHSVPFAGDASLFGAVAGEEAEDEDEPAQRGERHRVSGHWHRLPLLVKSADAGAHQHAPDEGADG